MHSQGGIWGQSSAIEVSVPLGRTWSLSLSVLALFTWFSGPFAPVDRRSSEGRGCVLFTAPAPDAGPGMGQVLSKCELND